MKNKYSLRLVLILIVLSGVSILTGVQASNYVKIAVIGDIPRVDKNQEPQKLVDQIIGFWKKQLHQVLAAKPDLIVLPEACDRTVGMTVAEQVAFFKDDYFNRSRNVRLKTITPQ